MRAIANGANEQREAFDGDAPRLATPSQSGSLHAFGRRAFEIELLPEAAVIFSPDGTILEANPRAFEIFEADSSAQLVGKNVSTLGLFDREVARQALFDLRSGKSIRFEVDFVTFRGNRRRFEILNIPIFDAAHKIEYFVGIGRDVTGQRRAEESRDFLAALVESSDDAIIGISTDLCIISWNAGAQRLFGYTAEQAIGRSADMFIPPESREITRKNMIEDFAIMRGNPAAVRRLEVPALLGNGRVVELSMVASGIRNSAGQLIGISSIYRDVSKRKRAEREQALLAAIVESSDDAIVSLSLDLRITSWNRGAEKLFGFSAKEAIGQIASFYIPPELRDWGQKFLLELQTRLDRVNSFEVPCLRKDGDRIDTWTVCFGIRDAAGKLLGMSAIHRDITKRKRAECEQAFMAAIVNASDDAIIGFSKDIVITSWNPAAERAYGYSAKEAIGRGFDLFVAPDQLGPALEADRQLLETGNPVMFEQPYQRKDGGSFTALVNIFAIRDHEGNIVGGAGIGRNITELKRTQRELVEAREAALAASQAKSEFLSSMSHEIRTPMTAILGMAELLAEGDINAEQQRYLEVLNSNGHALLELINSILDLAKVESGRLSLELTDFDLREIVEKSVETLATRAHSKGLELIIDIAPDVPISLVGDPLRLRQVLINLVGNAIKFTEKGEVLVKVTRDSAAEAPLRLKFSVCDTGIGIPAAQIPRLFSPFTQADSSTARKFGGSGLGLAIVKRLVGLMEGEVGVESEPGKGSVFSFTARFEARPQAQTLASLPRLEGVSAVVADANPTTRSVLREIFEARGAIVKEASSCAGAVDEIRECASSLAGAFAIVDDHLPEADHCGIAQVIAAANETSRTVIVMIRSDNLAADTARLRSLGLANYLTKPVKLADLSGCITSALDNSSNGKSNPDPAPQASKAAASLPIVNRALRILFADDSADNRALVRAYLKRTPYHLDEVENGARAIDAFVAGNYDVILMDIQMPEVDGYEATRAIREWEQCHQRPRTPVIALTASAFPETVRLVRAAGCDMHVAKPVKKAVLLQAIHDAVRCPNSENCAAVPEVA